MKQIGVALILALALGLTGCESAPTTSYKPEDYVQIEAPKQE